MATEVTFPGQRLTHDGTLQNNIANTPNNRQILFRTAIPLLNPTDKTYLYR
jgi:hypothetical protein